MNRNRQMVRIRPGWQTLLLGVLTLGACADEQPQTAPQQHAGSPFHYPEELWDAGVEGETLLRIFVAEAGTVDTIRIEHTSGYAEFDSSAVKGARELRFDPAHRGTRAVGAWVLLPVQFDLPASDSVNGGPQ
jgi:protein TonB